jgi:hypothetical protein
MGPREALQRVLAIVKVARTTDDVEKLHGLLQEIEVITTKAIARSTLRQGRLTRA